MTEETKADNIAPIKKRGRKPNAAKITAANRSGRPRRSAVGGKQDVLGVDGPLDPNYNWRIVNDEGSEVDVMKSYGYEVYQGNEVQIRSKNPTGLTGSGKSVVVDKRTGKKGVLMRQPIEFHEEDRKLRAQQIAETEKSIFRKMQNEDGRYGTVEGGTSLAHETDDSESYLR